MKNHWNDFVTDNEIQEEVEIPSMEDMPLTYYLRWAGHVSGKEDHRQPKIDMKEELSTVHREKSPEKRLHRLSQEMPHSMSS